MIIRFETTVNGEQLIRPPAGVVLPEGKLEITIKAIESTTRTSREIANQKLRQCRVSSGRATGIDNESIDADLAREYESQD